MEYLLLLGFLAVGAYAWTKMGNAGLTASGTTPQPPADSATGVSSVFERMETVTVSRPEDMAEAISRVTRDRTHNFIGTNYVIGTPQVSADGLTANVPLYRQP